MKAPPLLVSYSTIEDYLKCLSPEIHSHYFEEIRTLVDKKLPPVVSLSCLGLLFGYSPKFLYAMSINTKRYYRTFKIPKGKKKRSIQAPRVALKVIQKWLAQHLADHLSFEDYVFGFIFGRSAADAAMVHCKSDWVYSVDIENFFPTTDKDFLTSCLQRIGYSEKGANIITALCCHRGGLPQGAPSSPVLSNIAMYDVDKKLKAISDEHNLKFTRYADDIVFSGIAAFPEAIKQKVADVFEETCWTLSAEKEYLAILEKGQRLKVLGLLVDGEKPRLTKGYRNRIRAFKHLLATERIREEDLKTIRGHINYSDYINSKDYIKP